MLRVGLTGGIGSGKSAVADFLAAQGAVLIDTDAIAHALTAPGGDAMSAIAAKFGNGFVTAGGALDRAKMRARVFADAEARKNLEAILHPLIRARAEALQHTAGAHASYLVFAVPLLVESGHWNERYDRVLVVDCTAATQIERVQQRSGLAVEQIEEIIASQATRETRLRAADDVIVNEDSFDALRARCTRLHARYLALAAARRAAGTL
ncbi:MAG TPA: dephospho-CoA kinase [Burkholderiaceae bacterium]|nr:dephospho-CoA kinase [Burkholderiaceae bacterium]